MQVILRFVRPRLGATFPGVTNAKKAWGRRTASTRLRWLTWGRQNWAPAAMAMLGSLLGCSSVDPGEHFQFPEIVFDQDYFYCEVEPILFRQSCGAGDSSQGDRENNCHYNVTTFRLSNYDPLVADSCVNGAPTVAPPESAQNNYQTAQVKMTRDPELSALLLRPTGAAAHPRDIFSESSAEAAIIRAWSDKVGGQ